MNDIRFDLNYMHSLRSDFLKAEGEVSSCACGFSKIAQKMESELSSFSGEGMKSVRDIQVKIHQIRDMKAEIDRKAASASSKKQKEQPPPPRPSVPSNATPEQRNAILSKYSESVNQVEKQNAKIRSENQKIDEYVSKCNGAKSKLEDIIGNLHQLEESMKSEIELSVSRVHEFTGKSRSVSVDFSKSSSAMGDFNHAFDQVYSAAEKLYLMEPHQITGISYMDKQFEIKNTHSHFLGSSGGFFVGHSNEYDREQAPKKETPKPKDTELLVKERDVDSFFESIEGNNKIKMPSANLHKLGGKKFTAKMNEEGYTLVIQGDGSFIDGSGMIHWEKDDD